MRSSACHIVYPVFPYARLCTQQRHIFLNRKWSGLNSHTYGIELYACTEPQVTPRDQTCRLRFTPDLLLAVAIFYLRSLRTVPCSGVLHRGIDNSGQGRGDNSVLYKEGLHCCAFFICFVLTYGDGHSQRWTYVLLFSFDGF